LLPLADEPEHDDDDDDADASFGLLDGRVKSEALDELEMPPSEDKPTAANNSSEDNLQGLWMESLNSGETCSDLVSTFANDATDPVSLDDFMSI